jgi:1-acyl-sn-glycerol-3-phosphate acyltransferase
MRPLYFLLRITLPYALAVFFRKRKTLNAQQKFNAQTIFVCNHPSAFFDPLVAANYQFPIVYFMTRGDIFKSWLHPITWASHMVPIYRTEQDGQDAREKNKDVFVKVRKVLRRKKSLILFAEGYTDNVFIRSLKTIKKGPARIGFGTMDSSNWELDINVQAIGLNYTHPKHFRSDVVIKMGELIPLKDYKSEYLENPNKAITDLTRRITESMQKQITYIEDKTLADFVEHLLILSRKGMNNFHFNPSDTMEDRFRYSQHVADTVNAAYDETEPKWKKLKMDSDAYFRIEKQEKINENWVYKTAINQPPNTLNTWFLFILGLPITILGLIHQFIPYIIVKRFVESSFKRDVFWSGVKITVGAALSLLYNLPAIFLFHHYVYESYLLAIAYFLIVPTYSGLFAYMQIKKMKDLIAYQRADKDKIKTLTKQRADLLKQMDTLGLC